MNSYNEDLNSSVADSLNSQATGLKTVYSEANASMFALYYAEDASLSAAAQVAKAKAKQSDAETRKEQAVDNSNISINLLSSANQANQYLQKSVVNTAIAASNVQLASKAIVKLASDIGSIYNIVQAADFHSEISDPVELANDLITKSAYAAEYASQIAMETSILTSQVPAATLLDKAKSSNSSMNDLLKIIVADYDAKSQAVVAANAILATDRTSEKSAEGEYEDINTVYEAATAAYKATNHGLNLGLEVTPGIKKESSTSFTIQFNLIKSAFDEPEIWGANPVKDYYAFVVNRKKKGTFSINSAKAILQNSLHRERFISLNSFIKQTIVPNPVDPTKTIIILQPFNHKFNYLNINVPGTANHALQDSDGEEITTGTYYSVFILAVYKEEYKNYLNTYDDFLSAPSQSFCLTHQLAAANMPLVISGHGTNPPNSKEQKISFSVTENPDYADQVEYRCILLPLANKYTSMNQANTDSLKELDSEIAELEKIAAKMNPALASFNADILAAESKINTLTAKSNHLRQVEELVLSIGMEKFLPKQLSTQAQLDNSVKLLKKHYKEISVKGNYRIARSQQKEFLHWLEKDKNDTEELLTVLSRKFSSTIQMKQLTNEKTIVITNINKLIDSKIDFLFNLVLAEQVPAGNYLTVNKLSVDELTVAEKKSKIIPIKQKDKAKTPGKADPEDQEKVVYINADATDNFGNLLVKGARYIPVILSFSIAEEENLSKFANAWTGYGHSHHLTAQ